MGSTAWVGLVVLTCAMVLGMADQTEVQSLDAEGSIDGDQPTFQSVPGVPAGSEVYKSIGVESREECSGICSADDDCKAYKYDANFKKCELMKTDSEKLERQAQKAESTIIAEEGKKAEAEAETPRDKYRAALRKEKEAKVLLKDKTALHHEL